MPLRKCLLGSLLLILGTLIGIALPAHAQRAGGGGAGGGRGAAPIGTTVSATYKGLTTTRSYQPLPTTATAPAKAPATAPTIVTTTYPAIHVVPIDPALRRTYRIDPFYTKTLTIGGIVIMGSDKVSDWAFLEAAYTLDHQLHESPQWVHDALTTARVRLSIIAEVEYTMDLPENVRNANNLADAAFQDRRSRGLGGMPWCSCAEENLLNLRGDPYGGTGAQGSGENITIHEFSHTVASAINVAQGRTGVFWAKLRKAFADAKAPGGRLELFNRNRPNDPVYASTNEQEYWAEGAQAWFDNANPGNSGGISVRNDVQQKDPELAALLAEIYGDGTWRYIKTTAKKTVATTAGSRPITIPLRPPEEFDHLVGLDALRPQFPVFTFNNSPRIIAQALAAAAPPASQTAPAPGRGPARPATATTSAPATATPRPLTGN